MKILGIIPARAGSKRIIGKNMKLLNGKPLTQYTIEAALNTTLLDDVVVSSDGVDVLKLAEGFEGIIPIRRPDELCTDISPAIDYIHHVLDWMQKHKDKTFDIIVIMQPTSPLTLPEDIDDTIQLLLNSKDADSAVSIVKLNQITHPYKLKKLQNGYLKPFMKAEKFIRSANELPDVYTRNGSVYVSRLENINKGIIAGDQCLAHIMPEERSIDINEQIDFEFAEFLLHKQMQKNAAHQILK